MTASSSTTTRVVSESGSDVGPGQRLREAREAAQLTVAEVASRLRLVPRVLVRLENDDYEQLHGPTFVRGYLSSYARLLDLPERPILESYERHGYRPPPLVSELGGKPEVHVSDFPVRMVTYVIAGLLVLLVVLWWQSQQLRTDTQGGADFAAQSLRPTSDPAATDGGSAQSPPISPGSPLAEDNTTSMPPSQETAEPPAAEAASEGAGEGDARQPQLAMLDEQTTGSETVPIETPPGEGAMAGESRPEAETGTGNASPSTGFAAEPVDEAASQAATETAGEAASPPERLVSALETTDSAESGAATTTAGVEEEATPAPRPAPLPGSDTLAIRLARESWVEIYDRGGGRLYFDLAAEGSEVFVRGAGPMRVLLGNVQGAAVAYNGAPYDLSRYRGRSVVRFTVGELPDTTAPESPAPAATEPLARETREPAAEDNEHSVADASAARTTPAPEPTTPAPDAEPVQETTLPAPAASAPEIAPIGNQPDH